MCRVWSAIEETGRRYSRCEEGQRSFGAPKETESLKRSKENRLGVSSAIVIVRICATVHPWSSLVSLTLYPGKHCHNFIVLLQVTINRRNDMKFHALSFGLRGEGGLRRTAAWSLSLLLEARDGIEVTAPENLTLRLSASLQIHLKTRMNADVDYTHIKLELCDMKLFL